MGRGAWYYDIIQTWDTYIVTSSSPIVVACPKGHNINLLCPSDIIWWHISGSTLAQVMASCLTSPSHYLNQCWLIINKVQRYSHEWNFTRDIPTINHESELENHLTKLLSKSHRGQWVNINYISSMITYRPSCGIPCAACKRTLYLTFMDEL